VCRGGCEGNNEGNRPGKKHREGRSYSYVIDMIEEDESGLIVRIVNTGTLSRWVRITPVRTSILG
jgi:ferredoxin-NADP reductase